MEVRLRHSSTVEVAVFFEVRLELACRFLEVRFRYPGSVELADVWKVRHIYPGTVELADD